MLDLSGGLTTAETIRLCRRFEELDIVWIEEPADPFDIGALKQDLGACRRFRSPWASGSTPGTDSARSSRRRRPTSSSRMSATPAGSWRRRRSRRWPRPTTCASRRTTAAARCRPQRRSRSRACIANFMTLEIYPYFPGAARLCPASGEPAGGAHQGRFLDVPAAPGLGAVLAHDRAAPFSGRAARADRVSGCERAARPALPVSRAGFAISPCRSARPREHFPRQARGKVHSPGRLSGFGVNAWLIPSRSFRALS